MGNTLQKADNRNYLWDNFKTFLIFTVVIGHFLENFTVDNFYMKALDYWIYTFHMPAFLFVSGYLSKRYCKDSKVRPEKIGNFIAYYAIFQVLYYIIAYCAGARRGLLFFTPSIGLWYLLAIIAYYLIIPLAEKLPAYIVLPVIIFLGLTIGCASNSGTFLSASRTFVFAPFFFLGYYTPEKLINKLRSFKLRIVVGIGCAILSVAVWATIIIKYSRSNLPMKLFYGKYCYEAMGFGDLKGVILRTIAWGIGLLMILSLIMLIPGKKNCISYIGKNSLQVYLLHFIPFIITGQLGLRESVHIDSLGKGIVFCLMGVAFTFFLSIPVFSYPFKWIQKGVSKLFTLKKHNSN